MSRNDYPIWLRRFAFHNNMDPAKCLVKSEYEREEVPKGWQLTGRIIYFVKDEKQSWIITVEKGFNDDR